MYGAFCLDEHLSEVLGHQDYSLVRVDVFVGDFVDVVVEDVFEKVSLAANHRKDLSAFE